MKQPRTKLTEIFFSLFFFFLDNGNGSRLAGSFPIYPFLLLYLSSYQSRVSLAVGILRIHPLRVTCNARPLRVAFFRVTRGVAICSLLFLRVVFTRRKKKCPLLSFPAFSPTYAVGKKFEEKEI